MGVMFGPDGTVLTRNPRTDTRQYRAYVDFSNGDRDGDGELQDVGSVGPGGVVWWAYDEPDDENNINFVKFLSVYDDDEAREHKTLDWSLPSNWDNYVTELTGPDSYIDRLGRRIHFNRYTGVVMTTKDG